MPTLPVLPEPQTFIQGAVAQPRRVAGARDVGPARIGAVGRVVRAVTVMPVPYPAELALELPFTVRLDQAPVLVELPEPFTATVEPPSTEVAFHHR